LKKLSLLIFLSAYTLNTLSAQDLLMQDGTFSQCSGILYDSGGSGAYGNSENYTLTICPDSSVGTAVQLDFTFFETQNNVDILSVYDGSNTSASLLGSFSGTANPGIILATNATGCLTLSFNSNTAITGGGFTANISCATSCQDIDLSISSSPAATASGSIIASPGDNIDFEAIANFSVDGTGANYTWSFGDGAIESNGSNSISHSYNAIGTYTVSLTVTDTNPTGCSETTTVIVQILGPYLLIDQSTYSVDQLVEDVLINSSCAEISNIISSTGTNFGSSNGIGYFIGSGLSFPFIEGVVLSTGDANQSGGPETGTLSGGSYAWPGDLDLANAIPGLEYSSSYNATYVQFDFVPKADTIEFNFIFASEEYGTFQCSYTDAFAFLLTNNQTGQTTNLAVVPGTADPISVLSVRDNTYNTGCTSVNEEYFEAYYGPGGLPVADSPIDFRGHTVSMAAQSAVIPDTSYTIKLVIADDFDYLYDAAVFLEAGSFNLGGDLGDDITIEAGTALCDGGTITLDTQFTEATHVWYFDGVVIEGASNASIDITEEGLYAVDIIYDEECTSSDSILIEYKPSPIIEGVEDLVLCDSGNTTFDLSQNNNLILGSQDPSSFNISYHTLAEDAEDDLNPITTNLTDYTTSNGNQTIYIRIEDAISETCYVTGSFELVLLTLPMSPISNGDLTDCDSGQTLTATATVNSGETLIWYDAASGGTVVSDPSLTGVGTVTYYAEATNDTSGCVSVSRTPVSLTIQEAPPAPISNGDLTDCDSGQTLTAAATVNTDQTLTWYDAASGGIVVPDPSLTGVGTVTYYAEASDDVTACISTTRTAVTLIIEPLPDAPISNGDLTDCDSGQTLTATATVNTDQTLTWYDAASGGTVVSDPSLTGAGTVTYYAEATNDTSGCISSTLTPVTLTIEATPPPPISNGDLTDCDSGQTLTAAATVNTDQTLTWYDAASGGTVVPDPSLTGAGTVTYYAEATDATTGCVSVSRTPVSLTIGVAPSPPVGTSITACDSGQTLTATATVNSDQTITWYDAASGGIVVPDPSLTGVGTVTYYAEASDDVTACISTTRTAVTLIIEPLPDAPISNGDLTDCDSGQTLTATATVNTDQTLTWYDAASGGTVVSDPSLTGAGTVTYYAEATNDTSGCISSTLTPVTLTIEATPPPPISNGDLTDCDSGQTLTAAATVNTDQTLTWYDAASGGTVVPDPSLTGAGTVTYYAETTDAATGCTSLTRTVVILTINSSPAAAIANNLTDCDSGQTLTATATVNTDQTLTWYDAASGGTVVSDPSLTGVGTVTYYAEATNDTSGCVSVSRTPVSLTIQEAPPAPISNGDLTDCDSGQTLTATATVNSGETLIWYDAASGGIVVSDPSLTGVGTVTYYAEASDDVTACISTTRTAVTLIIEPLPDAPISNGDLTDCDSGQTLTATATVNSGETLIWYDAASGGTVVSDPSLTGVGTVTYYAEATNDTSGCVSVSRTPVSLTIQEAPPAPISNGDLTDCDSGQTLTAAATVNTDQTLTWYDAASGGIVVPDPSLTGVGTVTYYAEASDDVTACISTTRTAVTLIIEPLPDAPISNGDLTDCDSGQTLTATATVNTDQTLTWYDAASGGTVVSDPSLTGAGTVTYYAEATNDTSGCISSTLTPVTLTIQEAPPAPISNGDLTDCDSGQTLTAAATVNTDQTLTWYDAASGGTVVPDPSLTGAGTVTYYAEATDATTGCVSVSRTPVSLTIGVAPSPPVGTSITACDSGQTLTATATVNSDQTITWYDAASGGTVVSDPSLTGVGTVTYYAEASDDVTACISTTRTAVTLIIEPLPDAPISNGDLTECDSGQTLTATATVNSGESIVWYDAASGGTVVSDPSLTGAGTVTYYAEATDTATACTSAIRTALSLTLRPLPFLDLESEYVICEDTSGGGLDSVEIDSGFSAPDYSFIWVDGSGFVIDTASAITIDQSGTYSLEVTDNLSGCSSELQIFTVSESGAPEVTAAVTTEAFADTHVIVATASGTGIYEFSLDQGPWQDSGTFIGVSPGQHTVSVRDVNGCGVTTYELIVIDYPAYFTPNGDGYNDSWNVGALSGQLASKIYIFDRYGKLLKQISPAGEGWDGTYNGQKMPTTDYWFLMEYNDFNTGEPRQLRSHFALKR
jgi:gliding motility-associated-like protein